MTARALGVRDSVASTAKSTHNLTSFSANRSGVYTILSCRTCECASPRELLAAADDDVEGAAAVCSESKLWRENREGSKPVGAPRHQRTPAPMGQSPMTTLSVCEHEFTDFEDPRARMHTCPRSSPLWQPAAGSGVPGVAAACSELKLWREMRRCQTCGFSSTAADALDAGGAEAACGKRCFQSKSSMSNSLAAPVFPPSISRATTNLCQYALPLSDHAFDDSHDERRRFARTTRRQSHDVSSTSNHREAGALQAREDSFWSMLATRVPESASAGRSQTWRLTPAATGAGGSRRSGRSKIFEKRWKDLATTVCHLREKVERGDYGMPFSRFSGAMENRETGEPSGHPRTHIGSFSAAVSLRFRGTCGSRGPRCRCRCRRRLEKRRTKTVAT